MITHLCTQQCCEQSPHFQQCAWHSKPLKINLAMDSICHNKTNRLVYGPLNKFKWPRRCNCNRPPIPGKGLQLSPTFTIRESASLSHLTQSGIGESQRGTSYFIALFSIKEIFYGMLSLISKCCLCCIHVH